jgi:hypothetical protein
MQGGGVQRAPGVTHALLEASAAQPATLVVGGAAHNEGLSQFSCVGELGLVICRGLPCQMRS